MGWGENDRGVSFTFGAEVAAKFLHKHDFDLICRAHQVSKCAVLLNFSNGENDAGLSFAVMLNIFLLFVTYEVGLIFLTSFLLILPGRRGRLRVLRQAATGHALLRAQLLRGVRQRGRHDVRRRDAHVLIPDPQGEPEMQTKINIY